MRPAPSSEGLSRVSRPSRADGLALRFGSRLAGLARASAFLAGVGASVAVLVACATSSDGDLNGGGTNDGGATGPVFAAEAAPPNAPQGEVYGHSDTILYAVDTGSRNVREVGTFTGCTHVADIALDEQSRIYASTGAQLWLIENSTGRCTRIADGTFPNSLSFVPAGTLDPAKETLVGFQGGDYMKIDPSTGAVTKVGELGGGYESSGDLVSVQGGGTYLTVKGKECADCLVEIDAATGALKTNYGSIGSRDAFGLAFWGGELYAFTNGGEVILVKLADGKMTTEKIAVTNAPADLAFRGAGSTTTAPLGPVK